MRISNQNIQRVLAAAGYYSGQIDGVIGPKMKSGVSALLGARSNEIVSPMWAKWPWRRKSLAAFQLVLKHAGFPEVGAIDGLEGMMMYYAFDLWQYQKTHGTRPPEEWRPDDVEPDPDDQKNMDLGRSPWPLQKDLTRFYGEPGGQQCTAGLVNLPFPMTIAWDRGRTIKRFSCHEKVADSVERVYQRIASAYPPEDITRFGFDLFGGCYNYRKKRGGTTLSTHAYGIAIDTDPKRNQLRWHHGQAELARPECDEFWECWESEGWLSLGRSRNFDWMHVQAARI